MTPTRAEIWRFWPPTARHLAGERQQPGGDPNRPFRPYSHCDAPYDLRQPPPTVQPQPRLVHFHGCCVWLCHRLWQKFCQKLASPHRIGWLAESTIGRVTRLTRSGASNSSSRCPFWSIHLRGRCGAMRNFGTRAGDAAATAHGPPLVAICFPRRSRRPVVTACHGWQVRSRLFPRPPGVKGALKKGVQHGPSKTLATLVGFLAQLQHRHKAREAGTTLSLGRVPRLRQRNGNGNGQGSGLECSQGILKTRLTGLSR